MNANPSFALATQTLTGTTTLARLSAAGSPDTAGVLAITGPSHTATYTFVAPYTGVTPPIVIITSQFDPGGANADWWITYTGTSGAWTAFTVNNSQNQAGNINYLVFDIG